MPTTHTILFYIQPKYVLLCQDEFFYSIHCSTTLQAHCRNLLKRKSNVVIWINVHRHNNIITHHHTRYIVLFKYYAINGAKMVKTVTQILYFMVAFPGRFLFNYITVKLNIIPLPARIRSPQNRCEIYTSSFYKLDV